MIRYRAAWVLPIVGPPVRNGWVSIDSGRIVATGNEPLLDASELGSVAILPGVVNAHTHLELSYLRGRIEPTEHFLDWIRAVVHARREVADPADPSILRAAQSAIRDARAAGTAIVGDVTNTLVTVPLLDEASMAARVFFELLRFNAPNPEELVQSARERVAALRAGPLVKVSLAPHAPYSVSPGLFAAIRADLDAHEDEVSSVHLGESASEIEFLAHGTGAWRAFLEEVGAWTDEWRAPHRSPVAYLDDLGVLDSRVLAVHGVELSGEDLHVLRSLGVTLVSCPRSNRRVGVGSPPLDAFYAMGVDVAFGTDSLASVDDLNVFAEVAEARRLTPRVSARTLLHSATLTGARALRFDGDFGSIEAGKRAALIAVRVPDGVDDVEEYLVSGVEPTSITWLNPG
jgi:cytosine/adenosine deaminase-related metal-dependent hydrolase